MQEQIKFELEMLLNSDNLKGGERNKIEAICNDFLAHNVYMNDVQRSLGVMFRHPEFDFKSEIPKVILLILSLHNQVDYYKEIKQQRSKYLIYAVLYNYLTKYQTEILNKQDMGQFRLLFSNCWDLLATNVNSIQKRPWFVTIFSKHFRCCKSGKLSI